MNMNLFIGNDQVVRKVGVVDIELLQTQRETLMDIVRESDYDEDIISILDIVDSILNTFVETQLRG